MESIPPIGAKGINSASNAPRSVSAESRRGLLDGASKIHESENGERNALETGRFAATRSARQDGLGGALDINA